MRIVVVALAAAALAAQTVEITSGAEDHQVLQRAPGGKADVRLAGTASGADGKPIEARVAKGTAPVTGFTWKRLGTVENGKWSLALPGVPSGGPYRIEVRIPATKAADVVDDVMVGDIWVLAGQSNMEGVGNLENVQAPDDRVRSFDMVNEKWQVAKEPLHNLPGSKDRVHWRLNANKEPERYTGAKLDEFDTARKKGAGLGLPFASAYAGAAGVPVGLVPAAHGGTSMDQWDPTRYDDNNPGTSLYGSMIRRVQASGGKVKGLLWYQGESEANPKAAPEFAGKFERLIARVRRDFGDPNLPFYFVQIGRHVNNTNVEAWNQVQELQRLAETKIPNTAVFSAVDSDLDDGIHVSTTDLKRLGRNIAAFAAGKAKRGPRPVSATLKDSVIRVNFSDVNEQLTADGRISGFSIHAPSGEAVPAIYRIAVDPKEPSTVLLHTQGKLPEGATLRYGQGKDPYANLRDAAGFGVPAFGPLPIR